MLLHHEGAVSIVAWLVAGGTTWIGVGFYKLREWWTKRRSN